MRARNCVLTFSGVVPVGLVISSLFTGFPVVEAQNYSRTTPPHPLACTTTPKLQEGNCTYYCNIVFNRRNVVPYCEPDGKTLLTCGDTGVCRRGFCRDTVCIRSDTESTSGCLLKNIVSFCSTTIGEAYTARPTLKPLYPFTTTTEKTKYKEVKEQSSFSWKTLIVVIALFAICALALITWEKLSGFKFRDLLELRRSPRTLSPRTSFTTMEPSAPAINPSADSVTGFVTPPPINVPEPFSLPPDLPPSYEVAMAISDGPPSYINSKYKPGERRYM